MSQRLLLADVDRRISARLRNVVDGVQSIDEDVAHRVHHASDLRIGKPARRIDCR